MAIDDFELRIMKKTKQAYSVSKVLSAKFKVLPFDAMWANAIGEPELSGTWIILGPSKNGKTSFAMMLTKYISHFVNRVAYNSVEEGLSLTIQEAIKRAQMDEVAGRWVLLDKENLEELMTRLDKHKSPDVIVIDSVQFMGLTLSDYKMLKARYPHKLFIYVSHVEGNLPQFSTARSIYKDASVIFRIEGFKAFPTSRYGGYGLPIVIEKYKAMEYWKNQK